MVPLLLVSTASVSLGVFIYYKNYYLKQDENGVREDYTELIHLLVGGNSVTGEMQGVQSYRIRFQQDGVKQTYLLSEVDNRLMIVWTSESKTDARISHVWSFARGCDQYQMFEAVSEEVKAYGTPLLSTY
jgi:hypothetical protein